MSRISFFFRSIIRPLRFGQWSRPMGSHQWFVLVGDSINVDWGLQDDRRELDLMHMANTVREAYRPMRCGYRATP
jgi:hypothetical protein